MNITLLFSRVIIAVTQRVSIVRFAARARVAAIGSASTVTINNRARRSLGCACSVVANVLL